MKPVKSAENHLNARKHETKCSSKECNLWKARKVYDSFQSRKFGIVNLTVVLKTYFQSIKSHVRG